MEIILFFVALGGFFYIFSYALGFCFAVAWLLFRCVFWFVTRESVEEWWQKVTTKKKNQTEEYLEKARYKWL